MFKVLLKGYLLLYNARQLFAWCTVVYTIAKQFAAHGSSATSSIYSATGDLVVAAQAIASLEVVHAICGFVRAPVMATLVQNFGRDIPLLILAYVPQLQKTVFPTLLFSVWAITELIRYPFYISSDTFGKAPFWLTWLRYTAFIPLYPFGAFAEASIMISSLKYIATFTDFNLMLPNKYNISFNFYYYLFAHIFVLPFAVLQLYLYLFTQRKKKLAPSSTLGTKEM
mmetsp:Transcript_27680/g.45011  ORF Transcript_27680/g.45011 Transcript_27680/m.45011 type:complete len:226 (-) Transcript_27680:749-1426(-)